MKLTVHLAGKGAVSVHATAVGGEALPGEPLVGGLEMEFLDINSTKDSSLLLYAIHSPFYWRILKKTILFTV